MSGVLRQLAQWGLTFAAGLLLTACSAPAPAANPPSAGLAGKQLEILSWWSTGGEAAGLRKLYDTYSKGHAGIEIVNAPIAGGGGSNARAILKTRMLGGDPPDSFQVQVGRELLDAWVATGYMENLDDLNKSEGWDKSYPKGILELVSMDGHRWSVPLAVQRANMLWYNKKVFADLGLQPPKTFDDFFRTADVLQGKGITPLALGNKDLTSSTLLFETVLLGSLGSDRYMGLWNGKTDWQGSDAKQALDTFQRVASYVNPDHSVLSWNQANDLVLSGKAGMTIAGDWVNAYNLAQSKGDVEGWAPAPGNAGIFIAVSDSFGLPKNIRNRENAVEWLKLVSSKAGQEAFNPSRGSICARTDCDPGLFDSYRQSAIQDWASGAILPSLAYGGAADARWLAAVDAIVGTFVIKRDSVSAQSALVQACADVKVCK